MEGLVEDSPYVARGRPLSDTIHLLLGLRFKNFKRVTDGKSASLGRSVQVAWAEDRAMLESNLSAARGPETEAGRASARLSSFLGAPRDRHHALNSSRPVLTLPQAEAM